VLLVYVLLSYAMPVQIVWLCAVGAGYSQRPSGTCGRPEPPGYAAGSSPEADARLMGFRGGSAFVALVLGFGGSGGPVSGPMVARFLTES
jgi:hypothetical protein